MASAGLGDFAAGTRMEKVIRGSTLNLGQKAEKRLIRSSELCLRP